MTSTAVMMSPPELPAVLEDTSLPLPTPQISAVHEWTAIVQTGWQLALMPMMAWSSLYAASWQFWERSPRAKLSRAAVPGASAPTSVS